MERPYDPALKTLAELVPADWLPLAGGRRRRVTVEDADVGTLISGAADKLLRVHDNPAYLLHLDFESGHFHRELPLRFRLYNSVFEYRHDRMVQSVSVLLRPTADSPQWTGFLRRGLPGEEPFSTLRYTIIRVWQPDAPAREAKSLAGASGCPGSGLAADLRNGQLDPERLFTGGFGTLALAPISAVPEGEVQDVIRRMRSRLSGRGRRGRPKTSGPPPMCC